jgi:hypothetical protein
MSLEALTADQRDLQLPDTMCLLTAFAFNE